MTSSQLLPLVNFCPEDLQSPGKDRQQELPQPDDLPAPPPPDEVPGDGGNPDGGDPVSASDKF